MTVQIAVAGVGAFGTKHLDGLAAIDGAQVVAVVDADESRARQVAADRAIPWWTGRLEDVLGSEQVDAVILATPTPLHGSQALACLDAGKHVEIEIPLCDSLADGLAVVEAQRATGLVAMCGHTRRFNPSHQWVRRRITDGHLSIQHLDVQTFFFRRTNTNARGEPRTWTDHLLWHHAAHTIDLFEYQAGAPIVAAQAMAGPPHPQLGIAMDLSIQLRTAAGQLCSLTLSFNNDGPFGTFFRYIGDHGTYVARYDDLVDGHDNIIDVSTVGVSRNGIELQDREFIAAIVEGREPNSSVADVLSCYRVIDQIDRQLSEGEVGSAVRTAPTG